MSVWTRSATVMITGWMSAPSTDNGLTKTVHDTAPSAKVGVLVFFSLETDLVYGVTPPSTICVSCMPNNDDSAKVHFCLAKHI